jgi:hypothetical protein
MAENKMAEVAKMFGKKLGEEFGIKREIVTNKARFTKDGLEFYDFLSDQWIGFNKPLQELLTGTAVIVDD